MRTNSNDANLEDDDGADEEGEERGEATAVVVGDAREVRGELVEVDGARPAPRKRHVEHRRWGRGGIGEHFRMLLFLRWMCLYLSKIPLFHIHTIQKKISLCHGPGEVRQTCWQDFISK